MKRCEAILPSFAPYSSFDAGSFSMWQSMQVFFSTLSIRPMPLPVHAELRQNPGSSRPERWTGMFMSGEMKPRWQLTHSSVSTFVVTCALCFATEIASPSVGASSGACDHT